MIPLARWRVKLGLMSMWIVTIATPLVILPLSTTYEAGIDWTRWSVEPMYMFLFGAYNPPGGAEPSGWITGPTYLLPFVMLLLFFIVYAVQITIYVRTPTTQRWAIASGVLSLLIPFALTVITPIPIEVLLGAGGVYIGPLPFQSILGLIVMWIVKREVEIPKDELLEEKPTWWEDKRDDSE